jgi:hypothetical protein
MLDKIRGILDVVGKAIFKVLTELYRIGPWLLVALVAAIIFRTATGRVDLSQYVVAIYPLSVLALIQVVLHWNRKSLFHYAKLEDYFSKAAEHPIASAIVVSVMLLYMLGLTGIAVYMIHAAA